MAAGDLTIFNEAKKELIDGTHAKTDDIKCALVVGTVTPLATTTAPSLLDFTEVVTAGSYIAGGTSLGALSTLVTASGATTTLDTTVNPTWAQHAANDIDATWAIIYNATSVGKEAIAFVDLGGAVDMTAGDLTITWDALGLFTLT